MIRFATLLVSRQCIFDMKKGEKETPGCLAEPRIALHDGVGGYEGEEEVGDRVHVEQA